MVLPHCYCGADDYVWSDATPLDFDDYIVEVFPEPTEQQQPNEYPPRFAPDHDPPVILPLLSGVEEQGDFDTCFGT